MRVLNYATIMLTVLAAVAMAEPPAGQPAKPSTADQPYHGVFQFRSLVQVFQGSQPHSVLEAVRVEGGSSVTMSVPTDAPDVNMAFLKSANTGDLLDVVCQNEQGKSVVHSLKEYAGKLGEEEEGVYVFAGKTSADVGKESFAAASVTKFIQPLTMLVPNRKTADGNVPDEAILKAIDGLHEGDLVQLQAEKVKGQWFIKAAKYFEPYRRARFVRAVTDKTGPDARSGVEVKESSDTEKDAAVHQYYIDPKAKDASELARRAAAFSAGDRVLVRTASDDKGGQWLLGIKADPTRQRPQTVDTRGLPGNGGHTPGHRGHP